MMARTRWTFRPTSSQRSMASRLEPPVVTTSSTIAIDSPAETGLRPVCRCRVVWLPCGPLRRGAAFPFDACEREDGRRDRVGADRHAADEIGHVGGEKFEHSFADELAPLASRA